MHGNGTTTNGTKWLSRKTWRRLVELHATGRISREQFGRLKETLARERGGPVPPPPALRLVRGEAARPPAPPRYLVPASRDVA